MSFPEIKVVSVDDATPAETKAFWAMVEGDEELADYLAAIAIKEEEEYKEWLLEEAALQKKQLAEQEAASIENELVRKAEADEYW